MKSKVWYHFGNPFKVKFSKHFCQICNNQLIQKKHERIVNSNSPEAKYYDFSLSDTNIIGDCKFIHKVFYCSICDEEIEFITQLSAEDNQKWIKKTKNTLLNILSLDKIKIAWIDINNSIVNPTNKLENIQKIVYLISINDYKKIEITCSVVNRKNYWERPYYLTKNKNFFKEIKQLNQQILE